MKVIKSCDDLLYTLTLVECLFKRRREKKIKCSIIQHKFTYTNARRMLLYLLNYIWTVKKINSYYWFFDRFQFLWKCSRRRSEKKQNLQIQLASLITSRLMSESRDRNTILFFSCAQLQLKIVKKASTLNIVNSKQIDWCISSLYWTVHNDMIRELFFLLNLKQRKK